MFWLLASLLGSPSSHASRPTKRLAAEPLESREMLSAAGLVEVGSQPSGALDDKIVYIHGGHGITATSTGWGYQRPLLLDMVEDLGNQDQMTYLADYLYRAGATVVPLRPVGHQVNEAVLDNDDPGVSFEGTWAAGDGLTYYGGLDDTRYLASVSSTTETAVATYRPNLPEAGFYPVYAWSPAGANHATDQLYRVKHTGGATEVTVDHSRVGNGLIYLGTYYFEAGTEGAVEISNRSNDPGKLVVADMIRFGNGMGDIDRGSGVSGQPRENEAALYWLEWHATRSQGVPSSAYRSTSDDRDATVSSSPRYAAFMNQSSVGELSDRVFVSYHSNAATGSSRGVLALLNGNNRASAATPNQLLLAETLGREVNDDLVAQNGSFENDWSNRTTVILDRTDIEFGEINNEVIGNEFDATIIETGFHDNALDAEMLQDPRVRDAIAKATTQGLINYFTTLDGTTPDVDAPARAQDLSATSSAPGEVTLRWTPGDVTSYAGGTADGYMIYTSTNGYGFDGGTYVPGGGLTSHTLTGLTAGENYYFRIAAVNAGGEAPASEVVAVKPSASPETVLIVNGFDRQGRSLQPQEPFPGGGSATRVRPLESNSSDYAIQVADSIVRAGSTVAIETASNEAIASGAISLDQYDAVVWILGEESSADDTFNADEQAAVTNYLAAGGKLLVSGAEVAWDLDNLGNGADFYNGVLRADYVADDAGAYTASGSPGSIFEGLAIQFDDGSEFYDVNFPDVISPVGGSTTALEYAGGAGAAAIQYENGATGEQLVSIGFPFETIVDEGVRIETMRRILDYFGFATAAAGAFSATIDNEDGAPEYVEEGPWITLTGTGQRFVLVGDDATATWSTELPGIGDTEIFVVFDADTNRASGVRYTVTVGSETREVIVDQRTNDLTPVSLGFFDQASGVVTVEVDASTSTGAAFSLVLADQVIINQQIEGQAPNGDFNDDGVVDAADYTVWRTQQGDIVPPLSGPDADGSGLVDDADLAIWRATYGMVVPVAPAAVVMADPQATATEPLSTGDSIQVSGPTDTIAAPVSPVPQEEAPPVSSPGPVEEPRVRVSRARTRSAGLVRPATLADADDLLWELASRWAAEERSRHASARVEPYDHALADLDEPLNQGLQKLRFNAAGRALRPRK